jgi:uncharacterized protein YcnI
MRKRNFAFVSAALGAGALLAIAAPLAASAHVTISPYTAEPGSFALVTFKVPNESATAVTNRLEVDLPTATPFSSVSYVPVAGWDVSLVTETLPKPITLDGNELKAAVTTVIWTAHPGSEITAGQLQLFSLSLGAVPDTGRIRLPTTQTYSDGTVVHWDGAGAESEHPAPTLYVNDAPVVSHDADAEVTAATEAEAHDGQGTPGAPAASSSDPLARGLGIAGLVVGAVGIVLSAVTLRRRTAG